VRTVSVVIPTIGGHDLIFRAIESLTNESNPVSEIVVVLVGERAQARFRHIYSDLPHLRLIPAPLLHVAAARNYGAQVASGELLAFLDDDDYFMPGRIASAVANLPAAGGWSICSSLRCDESGLISGYHAAPSLDTLRQRLCRGNVIPGGGSAVIVSRGLFVSLGGFEERLHSLEDWEMWIRLAANCDPVIDPRPLVVRTVRAEGLSHSSFKAMVAAVRLGVWHGRSWAERFGPAVGNLGAAAKHTAAKGSRRTATVLLALSSLCGSRTHPPLQQVWTQGSTAWANRHAGQLEVLRGSGNDIGDLTATIQDLHLRADATRNHR
jgi:glycosyltransferase involved in cell wall biosynthesis